MYLKIVPAEAIQCDSFFMEVDRVAWQRLRDKVSVIQGEGMRHVQPRVDEDGEEVDCKYMTIGYTNKVVGEKDEPIGLLMVTAYQDGKPETFITAFESRAFLMNDKGITIDKVDGTYKF